MLKVNSVVNKILEGADVRSILCGINESISFDVVNDALKFVKHYQFKSVEELKDAWESGVGVPDNDDKVDNVVIDGKSVYLGPKPESDALEDADIAWFEDILTYCGIDIW